MRHSGILTESCRITAAAKLARDAHCPRPLQQFAALSNRGAMRAGVRSSGGLADLADLPTWAPLPETADELCDVAQDLGVDPQTHLYVGAKATETESKRLSDAGALATYKVVHFATQCGGGRAFRCRRTWIDYDAAGAREPS